MGPLRWKSWSHRACSAPGPRTRVPAGHREVGSPVRSDFDPEVCAQQARAEKMRLFRAAAVVDSSENRPPSPLTAAAVVAGLALAGTSAAITFATTASAAAAAARALMVVVPVAVGAWAWHSRPNERFGKLLMLTGFGWFLTTLAESHHEVPYSIGRVAGWVLEVSLIYL